MRAPASLSTSRLIALFNVPLALLATWLFWRSRDWPLVGDATILHFIAAQIKMGAVPYRDIADVNMPLTYGIHAAIVTIGGMSDLAWRAFDVGAAAVLSALIFILVAPAGRAVAILAVLGVLIMHLSLGPLAAGQRDFLMSIPVVAAALVSAKAAEDHERRSLYLLLAGALAVIAAAIKPTGLLLLFLPAFSTRFSWRLPWRDAIWIATGAGAVALLLAATLGALGALGPFVSMVWELLPLYGPMGARPFPQILDALQWIVPVAGLALAAAWGIAAPKPPRLRVIMGLTAFGLVHLLVQRKGWSYHVYPLGIGLACWGAWALAGLTPWRAFACLVVMAATLAWSVPMSLSRDGYSAQLRAAAAMQSALERHLPQGARVQVLDADNGAFLAMARAGMRQATPHIQWFSLLPASESVRSAFLIALQTDPPQGILLTNAQWPKWPGFEAADDWPEFAAFLASRYELAVTGDEDFISWRFYRRKG
jgi:hypothetical protein